MLLRLLERDDSDDIPLAWKASAWVLPLAMEAV
jgi:hypothetical protein